MKNNTEISKILMKNEELLFNMDIRKNAEKIDSLIVNDCIEISETGNLKRFKSGQICGNDGVFYITDDTSQLIPLSENCRLLNYTAVKVKNNDRIRMNCTSIWKEQGGVWKVVFHQRTRCSHK